MDGQKVGAEESFKVYIDESEKAKGHHPPSSYLPIPLSEQKC
jgi:hypothetical protein